MKNLINILIGLSSITLLLLGLKNMFLASDSLALYGIELKGALAFNTFRGSIGGILVGIGLMLLTGLFTKNKTWYHSATLLVMVILFGRIYSIIVDGFSEAVMPPIAVEVFLVIVLYFAAKQSGAFEK